MATRTLGAPTRSTVRPLLAKALVPVVCVGLALGAWYAVSLLLLAPERRFLLPPPHAVLTESLLDPATVETMLRALAVTARVALVGLLVAAVLGVAIGVLMSQARAIERVVYPYAVVLQAIPVLAVVPLIGLWFGYGMSARTIVCVLIAVHPIIAMTLFGIQSVDANLRELFTLGRATRLRRLLSLELPAALPSILTSLRTAAGLAVTGAIIGDMFFAKGQPGIGTLLDTYRARLQSEDLLAALLLAALFGVAVFALCTAAQRLTVGRWHASGR
ncbi:ABC transporter permease [Nocardia otitidiscaviarum]|uniref:ABC transporter permease subunit n=1 Tax=Nocardia otitidiscaviarum TaxID=1823 RepID=A0A516NEX9_9NOCA|nr:ABC transporter permease subunit [Nocardia otitidiscaviarum]MBF6183103.1 ABC transporter permease subunit [Nocardia otitidiscaviarum]MCP9622712.1 ABC transporter permease subunit [Nocardia otitidiscaviarum]QDP77451.1 ABC transporter permease subunit [Nocardia otitidiscaviarum]